MANKKKLPKLSKRTASLEKAYDDISAAYNKASESIAEHEVDIGEAKDNIKVLNKIKDSIKHIKKITKRKNRYKNTKKTSIYSSEKKKKLAKRISNLKRKKDMIKIIIIMLIFAVLQGILTMILYKFT